MMRCTLCSAAGTQMLHRDDIRAYYECSTCGLIFADPASHPSPEEERSRYATHENDPDDPRYRAFLSRLTDLLKQFLSPGMVGLDYGSGPGPTVGVMLGEARYSVTNYDPFFSPDREALERQYDFITCTETAEHFHDPSAEFERLDSLLRPGGILGVMTEMVGPEVDFANWWYRRDPTHVCFYRKETMLWIARRHAWQVRFPGKNVTLFCKEGGGRNDS